MQRYIFFAFALTHAVTCAVSIESSLDLRIIDFRIGFQPSTVQCSTGFGA